MPGLPGDAAPQDELTAQRGPPGGKGGSPLEPAEPTGPTCQPSWKGYLFQGAAHSHGSLHLSQALLARQVGLCPLGWGTTDVAGVPEYLPPARPQWGGDQSPVVSKQSSCH